MGWVIAQWFSNLEHAQSGFWSVIFCQKLSESSWFPSWALLFHYNLRLSISNQQTNVLSHWRWSSNRLFSGGFCSTDLSCSADGELGDHVLSSAAVGPENPGRGWGSRQKHGQVAKVMKFEMYQKDMSWDKGNRISHVLFCLRISVGSSKSHQWIDVETTTRATQVHILSYLWFMYNLYYSNILRFWHHLGYLDIIPNDGACARLVA